MFEVARSIRRHAAASTADDSTRHGSRGGAVRNTGYGGNDTDPDADRHAVSLACRYVQSGYDVRPGSINAGTFPYSGPEASAGGGIVRAGRSGSNR